MEATAIDPRDTMWEADDAAYRVYFWRGSPESAWASEEWRLTGADIEQVLEWSKAQAAGRYVAIWVEAIDNGQLGMIRLRGWEPTRDHEIPLDWVDTAT
jgi:hypothetical protein